MLCGGCPNIFLKLDAYLCGDVRVLLPVSVAVVAVDVVRAGDAVDRLQHDARVIVGYDVGVTVLGLVDLHRTEKVCSHEYTRASIQSCDKCRSIL